MYFLHSDEIAWRIMIILSYAGFHTQHPQVMSTSLMHRLHKLSSRILVLTTSCTLSRHTTIWSLAASCLESIGVRTARATNPSAMLEEGWRTHVSAVL